MSSLHFDTILIAGCGLLGGSLGMAARQRGLARRVIGAGRNKPRLELAHKSGAVDAITTDFAAACRKADLIVLCTPVATIEEQLATALREAPAGAIITDVGSTKASIARAAAKIQKSIAAPEPSSAKKSNRAKSNSGQPERPLFIGSHPMAGSERSGIEFAAADLYEGATCFVAIPKPPGDAALAAAARVAEFWRAAGCNLVFTTPARHDALAAAISHLPHFAAVALAAAVRECGESLEMLRGVAGNGFRDTSRVAAGDPTMWRDIARSNAAPINEQIATLRRALDELETLMTPRRAASLEDYLAEIQAWRRAFDYTPEPPA